MYRSKTKIGRFLWSLSKLQYSAFGKMNDILQYFFNATFGYDVPIQLIYKRVLQEFLEYHIATGNTDYLHTRILDWDSHFRKEGYEGRIESMLAYMQGEVSFDLVNKKQIICIDRNEFLKQIVYAWLDGKIEHPKFLNKSDIEPWLTLETKLLSDVFLRVENFAKNNNKYMLMLTMLMGELITRANNNDRTAKCVLCFRNKSNTIHVKKVFKNIYSFYFNTQHIFKAKNKEELDNEIVKIQNKFNYEVSLQP